jgi:hypothetical protein
MWKHLMDEQQRSKDGEKRESSHAAWLAWAGKDNMSPVERAAARVAWEAAWWAR